MARRPLDQRFMRVLVTGCAGHPGEGLVRTLRERRHELAVLDLVASPFTSHVGSICDRDLVRECVRGAGAIIHTATFHEPHLSTHSRRAFVETNVAGTLTVLEAALESGVAGARRNRPGLRQPARSQRARLAAPIRLSQRSRSPGAWRGRVQPARQGGWSRGNSLDDLRGRAVSRCGLRALLR